MTGGVEGGWECAVCACVALVYIYLLRERVKTSFWNGMTMGKRRERERERFIRTIAAATIKSVCSYQTHPIILWSVALCSVHSWSAANTPWLPHSLPHCRLHLSYIYLNYPIVVSLVFKQPPNSISYILNTPLKFNVAFNYTLMQKHPLNYIRRDKISCYIYNMYVYYITYVFI